MTIDSEDKPMKGEWPPEVTELLDRVDDLVVGGLCQMAVGGKHAFLKDIRKLIDEAMSHQRAKTN